MPLWLLGLLMLLLLLAPPARDTGTELAAAS
jgi:hypothetical protein